MPTATSPKELDAERALDHARQCLQAGYRANAEAFLRIAVGHLGSAWNSLPARYGTPLDGGSMCRISQMAVEIVALLELLDSQAVEHRRPTAGSA